MSWKGEEEYLRLWGPLGFKALVKTTLGEINKLRRKIGLVEVPYADFLSVLDEQMELDRSKDISDEEPVPQSHRR